MHSFDLFLSSVTRGKHWVLCHVNAGQTCGQQSTHFLRYGVQDPADVLHTVGRAEVVCVHDERRSEWRPFVDYSSDRIHGDSANHRTYRAICAVTSSIWKMLGALTEQDCRWNLWLASQNILTIPRAVSDRGPEETLCNWQFSNWILMSWQPHLRQAADRTWLNYYRLVVDLLWTPLAFLSILLALSITRDLFCTGWLGVKHPHVTCSLCIQEGLVVYILCAVVAPKKT